MFLIYDTETTGLPKNWKAPLTDSENWPRLVQLAWQLHDAQGKLISRGNRIVKPEGFTIPFQSAKIHGINTERAESEGVILSEVIEEFNKDLERATYVMGHNIEFDINIVGAELHRLGQSFEVLTGKGSIDSKDEATEFCAIPGGRGGKFKWPTLTELYTKLFNTGFGDAHDAAYDVDATARCFFELCKRGVIKRPELVDVSKIVYEAPKLEAANFKKSDEVVKEEVEKVSKDRGGEDSKKAGAKELDGVKFTHLHAHSQFSVLQAVSPVQELVDAAVANGMPAVSITDTGNMMGAFLLVSAANKANITPIVGIELNVCEDMYDRSHKDDGAQVILLAKNKAGYHNLAKLSSQAYTDGFYYVPRVDKKLVEKYKENLVVLTGGMFGEVPSLVLNVGEKQAEAAFVFWKELMGKDFYAELNRHGLEEEDVVNEFLLRMCEKHGVKYLASNNTYYTRAEQSEAHDILLCVRDARNMSQPKKYVGKRGREFRFGFPNNEFYYKSPDAMKALFADLPDAIRNVETLVEEFEVYELARDILLPEFDIPKEFVSEEDKKDGGKRGENAYLRHLTYEGAKRHWGEDLPAEHVERLDFELKTIENTGYPGYFLICADFIDAARKMGVSVGPGRGSAAGSAVSYCTGITNIDPIKYDLLFERFLNPDRVSMPDIDIDFDDEGRGRVIDYVIDKYGSNQVAQIITYGKMAAKSAIRDTARVLELPLQDADRIAKLIPDISLAKMFSLSDKQLKAEVNGSEGLELINQLKKLAAKSGLEGHTIQTARVVEGSLRNTGIHACGVIITPTDITDYVPVAVAKDSSMVCTQFDNHVAESAGLLKMDFLGLRTLTIIKDAVTNVRERSGVELDPEEFPIDDKLTYELFQRGNTIAIFQYESAGMAKNLKELKPTEFGDLIAMNALYRPGPMEYIPSFIKRKHGVEPIVYDLDACEEYLKETYGITVYQEQVMLLSQKLADFTKGEADTLRKAMGKKKADLIEQMKPKFMDQGAAKGHDRKKLAKIWTDWEAFASYAFNKSHSTCYAWIAYQTAYLKANYPAEFMAAVLSNNMNDIKKTTMFMDEARRMGIPVLGPDVNESRFKFAVNEQGAIRFGLGAIRGVGEGAVISIIENRIDEDSSAYKPSILGKKGVDKIIRYSSIFDFAQRVSLKDCNKRVFEALAVSGGFDEFKAPNGDKIFRSQYFARDIKDRTLIELSIKYGHALQASAESAQVSLFGGGDEAEIPEPALPICEPWDDMDRLNRERDVVGIYISGHPLDAFRFEMDYLTTKGGLELLENMDSRRGKKCVFGGLVSSVEHRISKTGNPWGKFIMEDYHGSHEFTLFREDYINLKEYMVEDWMLLVSGNIVKKRSWGDPEIDPGSEFKITRIEMLSTAREKKLERVRINLNLNELDANWIDSLEMAMKKSKGKVGLTIDVFDGENKIIMPCRSGKVDVTNTFIADLENICKPGVANFRFDLKKA
ncbi:MAG TPA: DNA polymerase III subunit alpha [Flavobacteriales bacterium]|jgi:DNA polymerase-3 subunit alpha|nr:DNA polymerase III subunit alpha [Flavobacteriales bacterium]